MAQNGQAENGGGGHTDDDDLAIDDEPLPSPASKSLSQSQVLEMVSLPHRFILETLFFFLFFFPIFSHILLRFSISVLFELYLHAISLSLYA